MKSIIPYTPDLFQQLATTAAESASPFSQEWVTITKEAYIELINQANYWKALHAQIKQKLSKLEEENQHKDAKIKDLRKRVFGKKSEKQGLSKSEKGNTTTGRQRGQQPGSRGHGRTLRPDLPVIEEVRDLPKENKHCPCCGLPYLSNPALDKHNEFI